jgi:hypothetical protein
VHCQYNTRPAAGHAGTRSGQSNRRNLGYAARVPASVQQTSRHNADPGKETQPHMKPATAPPPLPTAEALAGGKTHQDSMATGAPGIRAICATVGVTFTREHAQILDAALAYKKHESGARAAAATWPKVRDYCLSAGARLSAEQAAALQMALVFRAATGR